MKQSSSKWSIVYTTVTHNGVIDLECTGYQLIKDGVSLIKLSRESLLEVRKLLTEYLPDEP